MHSLVRTGAICAVLLALAGPARAQPAPGLAELIDRAWAVTLQSRVAAARGDTLAARELATRALFAGSPTVSFDVRRDLPNWAGLPGTDTSTERGRNELEPGIAAPVWLPGQRDAARRVLERERVELDASMRAARLRVAGEVREALWALVLARGDERVQEARHATAQALAADVERRVAAGDLAPADRLMATGEVLAARAALDEANAAVASARAVLARLTGLAVEPGDIAETTDATAADATAAADDAHPELTAARERIDAARERLALARATRRENPTVSAVGRFDRDVYGGPYRNSIRFGVAIPLDTEARNAPRIAAATAELTEAEVTLDQLRRRLAEETERARIAVAAARRARDTHAERADVALRVESAFERAFRAGERALPEVLRVRALALDASLAQAAAEARLGRAVARLNQARGVTP
jgi:cobalt-zinc-cadmium efflux system outer membrane protein